MSAVEPSAAEAFVTSLLARWGRFPQLLGHPGIARASGHLEMHQATRTQLGYERPRWPGRWIITRFLGIDTEPLLSYTLAAQSLCETLP